MRNIPKLAEQGKALVENTKYDLSLEELNVLLTVLKSSGNRIELIETAFNFGVYVGSKIGK